MSGSSRPVAVVTGASGGIGAACARALWLECDLALHYQKNAQAVDALVAELQAETEPPYPPLPREGEQKRSAVSFQADLSQSSAAAALIENAATQLGPPSILIHAAGHIVEAPLAFAKPQDWDSQIEVHAFSALAMCKAMCRYLRKTERGRIVLIGSLAGVIGLGNGAAYAAAKGALSGLCKSLSLETARWKTTVNAIAPGYVETRLTSAHDAAQREDICNSIPLGRYGSPEEIASLAAFLCSERAAYLTGQVIVVDGGMSLG